MIAASTSSRENAWLVPWTRPETSRLRLICIAQAGAGAAPFRAWRDHVPHDVELLGVRLPGREGRLAEPPHRDLEGLVGGLADAIQMSAVPYMTVGVCFGALVAFEVARELRRRGRRLPERLFMVSQAGPTHSDSRGATARLSDAPLAVVLRAIGETPEVVLSNRDVLALLEPALRADLYIAESYRYRHEPPLPRPIVAIGARGDRTAPVDSLHSWNAVASDVEVVVLDGSHLFSDSGTTILAAAVAARLQA